MVVHYYYHPLQGSPPVTNTLTAWIPGVCYKSIYNTTPTQWPLMVCNFTNIISLHAIWLPVIPGAGAVAAKTEIPCERASIARRKVFVRPKSFCA